MFILLAILYLCLDNGTPSVHWPVEATAVFVNGSLDAPLLKYRIDTGEYPSTAEGLQALITKPSTNHTGWRGPYIECYEVPQDPWGNPYQYRYPAIENTERPGRFDLFSLGADGRISDDDVGNWMDSLPPEEPPSGIQRLTIIQLFVVLLLITATDYAIAFFLGKKHKGLLFYFFYCSSALGTLFAVFFVLGLTPFTTKYF